MHVPGRMTARAGGRLLVAGVTHRRHRAHVIHVIHLIHLIHLTQGTLVALMLRMRMVRMRIGPDRRPVTGRLDGVHEVLDRDAAGRLDAGALRREIDDRLDPRNAIQRLLDAADARSAGHPLDVEVDALDGAHDTVQPPPPARDSRQTRV